MKKVVLAVCAFLVMLTSGVLAAEITLTDFSVKGSYINVKGIISEAENSRASLYIQSGENPVYIGQAEADKDGSFDLSFDASGKLANGSYTASIGATDCRARTVSFSYPLDKVYAEEKPTQEEKPELTPTYGIDVSAVKAVSRITVSGRVAEKLTDDNKVMLVIKKNIADGVNAENVAYIDQTKLDEDGRFMFRFNLTGSTEGYVAYLYADGRNISENIEVSKSDYEFVTAELEISKVLDRAVLLAKLTNNSERAVPYTMILAMYDKNNIMVGMKAEDASVENGISGQGTIELRIPEETVKIKAMLWDSREQMFPIAKPVAVEH